MSATTEPAFYDAAMTDAHEPAMIELERSPWLPLYKAVAEWTHPDHQVVDLGCGTGRFAELLRRHGHGPYLGLDFSPAAIAECRSYVPAMDIHTSWAAVFEVADLRTWEPSDELPGSTTFVCLETLEHLEDDVGLIRKMLPHREVIFSVPNFGGEAHIRAFKNVGDAWERYGKMLLFSAWQQIGNIHLYRAWRRADSW